MNYRDGRRMNVKLAMATVIATGMVVALNAEGYGVPAHLDMAVKVVGVAQHDVDNSQGVNGADSVIVHRNQQFLLPVDMSQPLTQVDVGKTALLTPNHQVTTQGDGIAIGEVMGVEPDGYAWVEIGYGRTFDKIQSSTGTGSQATPKVLTFSELTNCTYDGEKLVYISGDLPDTGEVGYKATISNFSPFVVTMPNNRIFVAVGDTTELGAYMEAGTAFGFYLIINPNERIQIQGLGEIELVANAGDKLSFTLNDKYLSVKNLTTQEGFICPPYEPLNQPQFTVFMVPDIANLQVKAV